MRLCSHFVPMRCAARTTRVSRLLLASVTGVLLLSSAVSLAQSPQPDLVGQWTGILIINGMRLHLAVDISRAADGTLSGELTSLDQANAKVPISEVGVVGRAIHMSLPKIQGAYDALLDPGQTRMEGDWTQNGPRASLSLLRVGKPPATPAIYTFGPPIEAHVSISPALFRAAGTDHVAYELWLTNLGAASVHIEKIEVLGDGPPLAALEGAELEHALQQTCSRNTDPGSISAGCVAVARIWLTLPSSVRAPAHLRHRITVDGATTEAAPVKISTLPVPVFGPLLRGGAWKAMNGPGIGSGHWATIIASEGAARLPDRFAIDWVKLGDDGKTFTGDPGDNRNYHAFGQPVLAVADGTVASMMDGVPQNSPGSHAVKITRENVCGNSVSIKISSGQYAYYCHMQAGSLKVRLGSRVRKGQVIGLVGNAGDSSEPHLHFQLSNTNSIAGSDGLPYVLDFFESQDGAESWTVRRSELPLLDQRIRFPE